MGLRFRVSLAAVCLIAPIAACGDDSTEPGDDPGCEAEGTCADDDTGLGAAAYRDGDRLHSVRIRADEGLEVLLGWYDTELGIDCRFGQAEDGVQRCIPTSAFGVFFGDADCTQAYVSGGIAIPPGPAYGNALDTDPGVCSTGDVPGKVYVRTSEAHAEVAQSYYLYNGVCQTSGSPDEGYPAAYVAPDGFVGERLEYEALSDDLGRLVAVRDDGSLEAFSAASPDELPCDRFGDTACVPRRRAALRDAYSDGTCTTVLTRVADATCGETVAAYQSARCEEPVVYEVGGEAPGLFTDIGPMGEPACTPLDATARIATQRSLDAFPSLPTTVVAGRGGSGVVARYDAVDDVPTTSTAQLETTAGVPCALQTIAGAYRCVPAPVAFPSIEYFADPACTQLLVEGDPFTCRTPPRSFWGYGFDDESLLEVAPEPFTGTAYGWAETCEPVAPQGLVYPVLGPIDTASLPVLEIVGESTLY